MMAWIEFIRAKHFTIYLFKISKSKSFAKSKMLRNLQNKLIHLYWNIHGYKQGFSINSVSRNPYFLCFVYFIFLLKLKYTCQYHIFMFMISKRVSESMSFSRETMYDGIVWKHISLIYQFYMSFFMVSLKFKLWRLAPTLNHMNFFIDVMLYA